MVFFLCIKKFKLTESGEKMESNIKLDFFYGNEANQFSFYRIPKSLFTDKRFSKMSSDAKILYGLLLDRMSLSIKNGWVDENNRVYIYFKVSEAAELIGISKAKVVRLFAGLDKENGFGLINRIRLGLGKPSVIYVMNFNSDLCGESEFCKENTDDFQKSQNETSRSNKTETLVVTKSDFKKSQNKNSGGNKIGHQEFGKSDPNDTNINNTDFNDTESILSDHDVDKIDRMVCAEKIKKNIGYEHLLEIYQKEDIDGLFNIIVDTVCSKKPYLIIAGEKTPKTIVAIRLLNLNSNHIEYVMDSLKKNATSIKNIKNYLLTALYNASSTIGHYYRAEANYDMNGGTI